MIALWLLTAHMFGDYVFSNRQMAANKLTNWKWRLWHVYWYTLAFIPVAAWYGNGYRDLAFFLLTIFVLHFLGDSKRFQSTFGDWLWWKFGEVHAEKDEQLQPNPWGPIPLIVDQSLHLFQISLAAALFLSNVH